MMFCRTNFQFLCHFDPESGDTGGILRNAEGAHAGLYLQIKHMTNEAMVQQLRSAVHNVKGAWLGENHVEITLW